MPDFWNIDWPGIDDCLAMQLELGKARLAIVGLIFEEVPQTYPGTRPGSLSYIPSVSSTCLLVPGAAPLASKLFVSASAAAMKCMRQVNAFWTQGN